MRIAKKILKIRNEERGAIPEMHDVFYNFLYFLPEDEKFSFFQLTHNCPEKEKTSLQVAKSYFNLVNKHLQ